MKNVAVVRVHESAAARARGERRGRQPAIKQPGDATHRARLRRVRVHNVRALAEEEAVQLPDRHRVLQRNLTAHLRDDDG